MKNNTPYHILLIEVDLSHIEIMVATIYLAYKHKIFNMEGKSLLTIASNSSQNRMQLKEGSRKNAKPLLKLGNQGRGYYAC